jgi:uncharacterized protein YkwD
MFRLFTFLFLFAPATWSVPGQSNNLDKAKLLELVNNLRKQGCKCGNKKMPAVGPVTWNEELAKAALAHSRDMDRRKYFSHDGLNGSTPGERIQAAGYRWKTYGENIGYNYPDEQAVVEGWLSSPNHCRTMMNGMYKEMGAARVGPYWTQDFGAK